MHPPTAVAKGPLSSRLARLWLSGQPTCIPLRCLPQVPRGQHEAQGLTRYTAPSTACVQRARFAASANCFPPGCHDSGLSLRKVRLPLLALSSLIDSRPNLNQTPPHGPLSALCSHVSFRLVAASLKLWPSAGRLQDPQNPTYSRPQATPMKLASICDLSCPSLNPVGFTTH